MGLFEFLKKKRKREAKKTRREILLDSGRITDGIVIDTETAENGDEIVHYHYNIHGVDFESTEILTPEQKKNPLGYAPGASVGVRFDPKNHGNSILI